MSPGSSADGVFELSPLRAFARSHTVAVSLGLEGEMPKSWRQRISVWGGGAVVGALVLAVAPIDLDRSPAETALFDKLRTKIRVSWKDEPLSKVLADLSQKTGVPFTLDQEALDEMGVKPDEPISLTANDVALGRILHQFLRPLKLSVCIAEERFLVTDEETARSQVWTRSYPVSDLAVVPTQRGNRFLGRELVLLIEDTVMPNDWQDVGGAGYVTYETLSGSLIVIQSLEGHGAVEEMLRMLRASRRRFEKSAAVAGGPAPRDFWSAVCSPTEDLRGLFEEMVQIETGNNPGVVGWTLDVASDRLLASAARKLAAKALAFAIEQEKDLEEADEKPKPQWVRQSGNRSGARPARTAPIRRRLR